MALDVGLGTLSPTGDTVQDDTLGGWVTVISAIGQTTGQSADYYYLSDEDPGLTNIYDLIGSGVIQGSKDVLTAAKSAFNILPWVLGAAAVLWFISQARTSKS